MKESRENYSDGRDKFAAGDYEAALKLFDKAVSMQEVLLGKFHKDTVTSYWWLGKAACQTQSEPSMALQAFHRAVRTGQVALGKPLYEEMLRDIEECLALSGWSHSFKKQQSSPTVLSSRSLSFSAGMSTLSNRSLTTTPRRSLRTSFLRSSLSNNKKKHMKILQEIVSHEQEGDKYFKDGRFQKAIGCYGKALQLQDQTMGTDSLDGADVRCKMAYSMLKDSATKQEARISLQMAYDCYMDKVGEDHPATYGVAAKIKTIVA
jgi:tetratricopeptide (TPR) repeat protein